MSHSWFENSTQEISSEILLERLRESEDRYRGLVESQNDLIVRIDRLGHFTFVNDAYCRKLGLSREELLGSDLQPYVHPEDRKKVLDFVRGLSQPPYRGILEHRSLFGTQWRLTLWEGYAIRNRKGKILEFQGVGRDIEDQRRMELQLKDSEERFRLTFENAPIAMCIVGLDGQYLQVNSRFLRFGGYEHDEIVRMRFQDITAERFCESDSLARSKLLSGEISHYSSEKQYIHKLGHSVWGQISVSIVRDINGDPLYFVSQVQDITELKQTLQQLQSKTRELSRSNEELEQFAFVVAHDLREPLRMISSFIGLMRESLERHFDEESLEYYQIVIESTKRLDQMIKDLLAFCTLDRTSNEKRGLVDLNLSLSHARLNLKPAIDESGAEIESEDLPTILGHSALITALFQNLIDNAIKYRRPSEPVRIKITATANADEWIFRVEDNGKGIEPAFRKKVFHIFQRLNPQENCRQTGIGLSLVKKIIEHSGGKVWIEDSKMGSGCAFCFSYPKSQQESI